MEVCPGFELIAIENATTRGDDLLKIGKGREVPVGQRLIQNRPQVLGGLQFGRVWGQVDGPDPIRNSQVGLSVPTGAVENEHDEAIPSRPGLAGKQGQQRGEERLGDPVRDVPEHLAEIGCTKAVT